MKALLLAATAALAVAAAIEPADAWMRGGGGFGGGWGRTAGGGFYHSGDFGGFEHGTAVGPNGVAHAGDAGGYWHGSAANGYGAAHASTYGGYYHGTYANGYGAWHTGAYGDYYHQPAVVNSYAGGCWNCGYGGWGYAGAAAAGAVAGAAVGAVATAAASRRDLWLSAGRLRLFALWGRGLLQLRRLLGAPGLWRQRRLLHGRAGALAPMGFLASLCGQGECVAELNREGKRLCCGK